MSRFKSMTGWLTGVVNSIRNFFRRSWKVLAIVFVILLIVFYYALPGNLFNDPYSTVLLDRNQEMLSATIASDGQWRFPVEMDVPEKFAEAIIMFEDKRFRSHWGVDPRSFARAIKQNVEHGKIVSGGSTITMQVIRLSRKGNERSFYEKVIEMILAARLELRYSKDEIIALYAAHAPFGGNVVGLEAACWRYFGRDPSQLSWGEAALLAVLPNAPSLLHPGKNRASLRQKRDRLLIKLRDAGKIDAFTCSLAMEEDIPEKPQSLPRLANHLLDYAVKMGNGGKKIITTLQLDLQIRVEQILHDHHLQLEGNHVFNGAALVVEVNTGNVLAYVGNTSVETSHQPSVDIIQAPRSTGSILKPFLFAALLDEGKTLPRTLWPDIPIQINGFAPQNFSRDFDGAVPADKALIRSLNIPAVNMLRQYRYEKFHSLLEEMGMTTLKFDPDHYGLSIILGGAEGTLWDITGMYASSARVLNNYFLRKGKNRYNAGDLHALNFELKGAEYIDTTETDLEQNSWLSAGAIYQTFDALKEVYRPGEESGWRHFYSSKKIAWKTGTSFGHRDAWAVGVTPDFVTGVWMGNADGEGRPGLTGTDAAAPVMLEIFSQLPGKRWFPEPFNELEQISVCKKSGYRNTTLCEETDTIWVTSRGLSSPTCPFHKKIHLNTEKTFRVHGDCSPISKMVERNWFVLPPVQEYYFRRKNIFYKPLPAFRKDCQPTSGHSSMDLMYPKSDAKLYVPRELDGTPGQAVFQLAHHDPAAIVYWHLDGNFIGTTEKRHFLPLNPREGHHILTIVDGAGEYLERHFEVLSK